MYRTYYDFLGVFLSHGLRHPQFNDQPNPRLIALITTTVYPTSRAGTLLYSG